MPRRRMTAEERVARTCLVKLLEDLSAAQLIVLAEELSELLRFHFRPDPAATVRRPKTRVTLH